MNTETGTKYDTNRTLQARSATPTLPTDPHRQALEQDRAAYLRLKDELLKTHRGQYVGFKDGEFVGSDLDWSTLVERMYDRFGYVPIYVKKVEAQERVCRVSGPRRVCCGPALTFDLTAPVGS
jgi:hypothetical protein